MVDEGLKDIIEKCRISGILENEKDAREVVSEIVRTGRTINRPNFIDEVIYMAFGVVKDENGLPRYRNHKITAGYGLEMNGSLLELLSEKDEDAEDLPTLRKMVDERETVKTSDLFLEIYGGERYGYLRDINRMLIPSALGEGCIKAFNYTQRKLNITKKQRVGGKELKDAHIFVHSARTAGILREFGATPYQIGLGLLHDVPEEMRDWRIEQREKAKGREKRKLTIGIRKRPEYDEIYGLFSVWDTKRKKIVYDRKANLMIYHLQSLSRWLNESYEPYSTRLVNSSLSDGAKRKIEAITPDLKKQADLYATPLIVKAADCLDNTIRVLELDLPKQYRRFHRNMEIIKGINTFLDKYPTYTEALVRLRDELIKDSRVKLLKVQDQYKDDRNPHMQIKLRALKKMGMEYNKLSLYDLTTQ